LLVGSAVELLVGVEVVVIGGLLGVVAPVVVGVPGVVRLGCRRRVQGRSRDLGGRRLSARR
jgi:hypothetical protein